MQMFEQSADQNVLYTNTTVAYTAAVQTLNFAWPARHIIINNSGTSTLAFTLDGSTPALATSANFPGGAIISMDGLPASRTLKYIASAASGSINVFAW